MMMTMVMPLMMPVVEVLVVVLKHWYCCCCWWCWRLDVQCSSWSRWSRCFLSASAPSCRAVHQSSRCFSAFSSPTHAMNANSSPLSTAAVYQPSIGLYGSGSSAPAPSRGRFAGAGGGFATAVGDDEPSEQIASRSTAASPHNRLGLDPGLGLGTGLGLRPGLGLGPGPAQNRLGRGRCLLDRSSSTTDRKLMTSQRQVRAGSASRWRRVSSATSPARGAEVSWSQRDVSTTLSVSAACRSMPGSSRASRVPDTLRLHDGSGCMYRCRSRR